METKMKKIDLAEKANAYYAKQADISKQKAVEFVETTAIPFLTDLAIKGSRFAMLSYPSDLYPSDVINALTERVECYAKKTVGKNRLSVSW